MEEPIIKLDRTERRRKDLLLEGHLLGPESDEYNFFIHLGADFLVLNVPYGREGLRIAELFSQRLGAPSRGPETKCGGGCVGQNGGSALVTTYLWDFPAEGQEEVRRRLAGLFGKDWKEQPFVS